MSAFDRACAALLSWMRRDAEVARHAAMRVMRLARADGRL